MDLPGKEKRRAGEKWWQDWRWIAAVAGLLAAGAFISFVITTIATNESVTDIDPILKELKVLAESNAHEIERIDASQAGIDELVAFVRDIQQRQPGPNSNAQMFIDLLCSSSDPVRLEACHRLRGDP